MFMQTQHSVEDVCVQELELNQKKRLYKHFEWERKISNTNIYPGWKKFQFCGLIHQAN